MALYPIINTETGETKTIEMSVHDITQWYKDNPNWKRNWSQGCASPGEVGEWKDKLIKKNPGWNDILQKVNKSAGSQSKIGKI
jgi:cytochrome c551/c552